MNELLLILGISLALVVVTLPVLIVARRSRVVVPSGWAIVVHGTRGAPRVSFNDTLVPPIVARAELVDCGYKTIAIVREGRDGLRCEDQLRVDIRAEFKVSIPRTIENVLQVLDKVGAARAADPDTLRSLFEAKFVDALATVIRMYSFNEVTTRRAELRDRVIECIDRDLGGYSLDDVSFTRIEQTPLAQLDPDDIHDAEAISRITERVAREAVTKSELEQHMRQRVAEQNIAASERELEIELELHKRRARQAQDLAARPERDPE